MPDRSLAVGTLNANAKKTFTKSEQTFQNLWQGKPRAQRFLIKVKALLPQPFSPEVHIPWFELAGLWSSMFFGTGLELN